MKLRIVLYSVRNSFPLFVRENSVSDLIMNFFFVSSSIYCLNICGDRFDLWSSFVGRICLDLFIVVRMSCITSNRSLFAILVGNSF
jgi:hypothetical protein